MRCDKSSPSTSSITSARTPSGFFETVDVRDIGMIQRREGLGFARETARAVRRSLANESGRTLIATSRFSFVSRAR